MTRDFVFTLPLVNTWYNLWSLIVADTVTYPTDTFMPSAACELEILAKTAGANVERATSPITHRTEGFTLTSGTWDINRAATNVIDLKSENFRTDTARTVIYVKIVAC